MSVPLVSAQWLFEQLENPKLVILDASPSSNKSNLVPEFTSIKIKGARIFDSENVFVDSEKEVPNMFPTEEKFTKECQRLGINNDSLIVVYDNLGIYMSPRVWWMFKSMGHKNIAVLDGGLSAWKKLNFPYEDYNQAKVSKGNFIASYQENYVKEASFILKNIKTETCAVVDARSTGRFLGELPEPRENMQSGHIPNSKNIPFRNVLNNGFMKPKDELKMVFKEVLDEKKPLVFTCGSGVTACIILLASELISDTEKYLYDGSWVEWGLGSKYPIEKS